MTVEIVIIIAALLVLVVVISNLVRYDAESKKTTKVIAEAPVVVEGIPSAVESAVAKKKPRKRK